MNVSEAWIDYAHGPGAESGQTLATQLCALRAVKGKKTVEITDPVLIYEIKDVAELYVDVSRGDDLYEKGPWWIGYPRKLIREANAALAGLDIKSIRDRHRILVNHTED